MCILCQLISFRKGLRYLLCHFDVEKDLNIVPALHIRYRNRKSMFSSLKLIFPHKNVEFVVEYNEEDYKCKQVFSSERVSKQLLPVLFDIHMDQPIADHDSE